MNNLPQNFYYRYEKHVRVFFAFLVLLLTFYTYFPVEEALATSSFSSAMVRFDRLTASIATTATVCAKTPAGSPGTEAHVLITFPTGFVLGAFGAFTVDVAATTSWPTGATAWLGIGTATAKSGQVVTFPSTALSSSTLYCFNILAGITNPAAANNLVGTLETQTSGNAGIQRSDWATSIISNDQIAVSASVSATMTFSLSANTMNIGTGSALTTSNVLTSSAVTAQFSTNASNGVIGWIKGANAPDATHGRLTSTAVAGATITSTAYSGTARAIVAGTADYLIRAGIASAGTGTGLVTLDPEYDYNSSAVDATHGGGGAATNVLRKIFTSNGTHSSTQVNLWANAAASATTPAAGDYADTLTVVVAGVF